MTHAAYLIGAETMETRRGFAYRTRVHHRIVREPATHARPWRHPVSCGYKPQRFACHAIYAARAQLGRALLQAADAVAPRYRHARLESREVDHAHVLGAGSFVLLTPKDARAKL